MKAPTSTNIILKKYVLHSGSLLDTVSMEKILALSYERIMNIEKDTILAIIKRKLMPSVCPLNPMEHHHYEVTILQKIEDTKFVQKLDKR